MKFARDMKRHLLIHTGEQPFICEFCTYTSNRKSNLKAHQSKYHKEQVENKYWTDAEIILKEWIFTLIFTFLIFQLRNILLQKTPIRIGPHQFGCPFCPKIMKFSGDMKRHLLIHTGEQPFSCDFCTYASNQKSNLKVHKNKYHKIANGQ